MRALPTIAVLGAPGSGAAALAAALQHRIAPGSAHIFCAAAAEHCADAALTLLMGLDQPCPAQDMPLREAVDAQLRAVLAHAEITYRVVYGQGERRTENALKAINSIAPVAYESSAKGEFGKGKGNVASEARQRAWSCEKCSDPVCEHRLFTSLVAQRG